jgi:hypothetical protein
MQPLREKLSYLLPFAAGCLFTLLALWLLVGDGMARWRAWRAQPKPAAAVAAADSGADTLARTASADPRLRPVAASLLANLRQVLKQRNARRGEAVLTFKNAEAYRQFLARARQAGLTVLGQLDAFNTVRVRYDSLGALQGDILDHADDYGDLGANYHVQIPQAPPKEDRATATEVPFGNRMLAFLGVSGDASQWGHGVTIALLDSGVAPDATFGPTRLRYLDIGLGTAVGNGPEDGHGTAVAALAAGASPDAPGVAPGADLLSIRVTAADGLSDIFTLSKAIVAAVDAGAQIVNVSLGAYANSGVLTQAINYATDHGVVIVAAAGNDQAAQLTWPAADPRVVSVGAVDALGQQVSFSNSGPQLQMTAPGYGVQTAWLDGQRVVFDGTSASSPIVAGAIAAMMSQNSGMTAAQAWQVLQQYSSDAGAPGQDPAYGNGTLNLGWAMNRNDPARIDTAVSSIYYDPANNQIDFIVQNRSGRSVNGLTLDVDAAGTALQYDVPSLKPAEIYVAKLPVDPTELQAAGQMVFRAQLNNPPGITDTVPANNHKGSVLLAPKK